MTYRWLISLLNAVPGGKLLTRLICKRKENNLSCRVFDLDFSCPVGIGHCIDTNGEYFRLLENTGVGFSCIGPLNSSNTHNAISHMIRNGRRPCIVTASIGPGPKALDDEEIVKEYVNTFSLVYDFAQMFIIEFTDNSIDAPLMREIIGKVLHTRFTYEEYKPVIIDTGHDIDLKELEDLVDFCRMNGADAIGVWGTKYVKYLSEYTLGRFPIVGYGNISTVQDGAEMLASGASLIMLGEEILSKGLNYPKKLMNHLQS